MSDDDRALCAVLPVRPSPCIRCDEPVTADDRADFRVVITKDGVAGMRWIHWECAARSILGGVRHLRGECGCFNPEQEGCDPDPPGMTKREAAKAALIEFRRQRGIYQH